jgi:hypothetical protein
MQIWMRSLYNIIKANWRAVGLFALVSAILIGIQWFYSRDYFVYYNFYQEALKNNFINRVHSINWLRDPGFFIAQAIFAELIAYHVWIGLLVLASLLSKYIFVTKFWSNPIFLLFVPYLLVLSYLHEGTQIRASIALAIGVWGFYASFNRQYVLACALLALAATFHLSVLILGVPLIMLMLYERYPKSSAMIFLMGVFLLMNPNWVNDLVLSLGGKLAKERYFFYVSPPVVASQNTSGLYIFFIPFVLILVSMIWLFYRPSNREERYFAGVAKMSGALALAILGIFQFSVIVSSRLVDLLLLPALIVFGALLWQWWQAKKYGRVIASVATLIVYCAVRSYISFGPILTKPIWPMF